MRGILRHGADQQIMQLHVQLVGSAGERVTLGYDGSQLRLEVLDPRGQGCVHEWLRAWMGFGHFGSPRCLHGWPRGCICGFSLDIGNPFSSAFLANSTSSWRLSAVLLVTLSENKPPLCSIVLPKFVRIASSGYATSGGSWLYAGVALPSQQYRLGCASCQRNSTYSTFVCPSQSGKS